MSPGGRLAAALRQVTLAGLDRSKETLLQKHAVECFMKQWEVPDASACSELEMFYFELSEATGVAVRRPTAAVALLREIGLEHLKQGFSRLTSKRRAAAHPGATCISELRAALRSSDLDTLRHGVERFKNQGHHTKGSASPVPEDKGVFCEKEMREPAGEAEAGGEVLFNRFEEGVDVGCQVDEKDFKLDEKGMPGLKQRVEWSAVPVEDPGGNMEDEQHEGSVISTRVEQLAHEVAEPQQVQHKALVQKLMQNGLMQRMGELERESNEELVQEQFEHMLERKNHGEAPGKNARQTRKKGAVINKSLGNNQVAALGEPTGTEPSKWMINKAVSRVVNKPPRNLEAEADRVIERMKEAEGYGHSGSEVQVGGTDATQSMESENGNKCFTLWSSHDLAAVKTEILRGLHRFKLSEESISLHLPADELEICVHSRRAAQQLMKCFRDSGMEQQLVARFNHLGFSHAALFVIHG